MQTFSLSVLAANVCGGSFNIWKGLQTCCFCSVLSSEDQSGFKIYVVYRICVAMFTTTRHPSPNKFQVWTLKQDAPLHCVERQQRKKLFGFYFHYTYNTLKVNLNACILAYTLAARSWFKVFVYPYNQDGGCKLKSRCAQSAVVVAEQTASRRHTSETTYNKVAESNNIKTSCIDTGYSLHYDSIIEGNVQLKYQSVTLFSPLNLDVAVLELC